ncbi:hypothetical protein FISHEDRAFT_14229, partial [Fistulina hepatica ATCC 64428]
GAQLSEITMNNAYRAIKERQGPQEREKTKAILVEVREAASDLGNELPTDERIWNSIRDQDVTRNIQTFLWKITHDAYKVGDYWDNIPGFELWGKCPKCNCEETIEHILTRCQIPGQKEVWEMAKEICQMKACQWPGISKGKVIAACLASPRTEKGDLCKGMARLYKILITESAFLIWKLRCERRIAGEDQEEKWQTAEEIRSRWIAAINSRLAIDRLMTNRRKYGRCAIPKSIVLRTWNGTLLSENQLPADWITGPRVLVGIVFNRRPRGRNR